ncbi:unnamed protein product [Lactuca saligna]|uniref:Uncharacterized protein n=1 Tax=Lactuca saligna TaxID=75948 RepID=A0AA35VM13_LACSI|nr:unnamed protein product [Lactuca saligna]
MEEKRVLEGPVEEVSRLLEGEGMRRKVVEDDFKWLLQNGVFQVVEKAVECANVSLGLRCMKAACITAGVEGGKQVIREQISTEKFMSDEPSTLLEHTQVMHENVKFLLENDFASYLHLGELDMEGLRQLWSDLDAEDLYSSGWTAFLGVTFRSSYLMVPSAWFFCFFFVTTAIFPCVVLFGALYGGSSTRR